MTQTVPGVVVEVVGPASAVDVLAVVQAAFAARPPLDPPADALAETEVTMAGHLTSDGGLLASVDGRPVGALVFDRVPGEDALYLRRVGVVPGAQGHGVAHAMVAAALREAEARGVERVSLLAREELPATIAFWRDAGFTETHRSSPYVHFARRTPQRVEVPTADAMRDLGIRLAAQLRAGDVLVLSGELGAGKTTFTQGLGAGLGVRGGVTSPTFVIARVHPSLAAGPALVHVDAYRLGGAPELDDLDLDADLDQAVTVVEWGSGLAEALSDSPLEIRIERAVAAPDLDPEDDPRVVTLEPIGPSWLGRPRLLA
ncbi:tRNA (adenosine(37)-N6)-threonylcarbamoyltransferase complex ATPase subunit type 1 TsaE [Nocardioides ultimimeridianus]